MTAALERVEWPAARPGRTLPPGKTRYPFYRRLGGPQGRFGRAENLVPTGIRSRIVQLVVSRYTDWATQPTYSLQYWSYFLQVPPSNVAKLPRWREVAAQKIWPVPETVVTVLCTSDDGCGWHPKYVEWACRIINRLLCVASRWAIINICRDTSLRMNSNGSFFFNSIRFHYGPEKRSIVVRFFSPRKRSDDSWGPTQPPIPWMAGAFSWEWSGRSVVGLRMSKATPEYPFTAWGGRQFRCKVFISFSS